MYHFVDNFYNYYNYCYSQLIIIVEMVHVFFENAVVSCLVRGLTIAYFVGNWLTECFAGLSISFIDFIVGEFVFRNRSVR